MERLDSDKFLADECSITYLPQNSGQITDEENCNETLHEVEPVDVCREVDLNFKWRETLEKKNSLEKEEDTSKSSYPPGMKDKKWLCTFKKNTLNMAVVVTWRIRRKVNG
ncbi:hypothetical protein NPIL_271541 [Nephila pilipes]|uniref:Uncharacterized protein n=1 Tax=Nephila pilipes TaxID=299642 RepID=A0A8X6QBC1_NEPPI|nr:hypothetical protein NPIL_271541 [Nephila pilipes]